MRRWQYWFVGVIVFLYLFVVIPGAIYLANNNIGLLRLIGSIIGAVGIVLGLGLIVKLLSGPPFSTGEWREAVRAALKVLTFRA